MDSEKILEELQPIFKDVFDDDEFNVTVQTQPNQVEDWDSISQFMLITAIEKHFSIKFVLSEVQNLQKLNNVGELVELIYKKLN